jgi:CRISPR/Cas system-associated protein Cas7 (RAMP superfamily)|tara:strand:+ start:196 stop:411 length:216 start_codon:yes stop_codon:yes gene_type:complete
MFWKKQTTEEENKEPTMKPFTLKLKQDRNGVWICESARVQGDTIEEITERMDALIDAVISKTRQINGDDDE